MIRRLVLFALLCCAFTAAAFAQSGAAQVRNYVGLINQSYHPSLVSFLERAQDEMRRRGEANTARVIDIIISGGFGSGFLYSDRAGNLYVITNHHVIAQAHTVSITFEQVSGERTTIDNLRIIAVSEEDDLAILAIPPGHALPAQGLTFLARDVAEGEQVFSAGFPGFGLTPLWQFGIGNVSNAVARFPRSLNDPTMMGPFIQHTAPIDSGNSGGPLLVAQTGVPSGFAVAGINTLIGRWRQAANFAVPVNTTQSFIDSALNPDPATFRDELDRRLSDFVGGLNVPRAVFPHIAEFLSSASIGENIEFAFDEMLNRAGRAVVRSFNDYAGEDFIGAMSIPVAWLIEDNIRTPGTGALRASITEVSGSGEEYTVVFTIDNREVSSLWVREYGIWRIQTFGTVLLGEGEEREIPRQARQSGGIRTGENAFFTELGFANLFDKAPGALYASAGFGMFGVQAYYAGPDFFAVGAFGGWQWNVPMGNFGLMPHFRLGFDYQHDQAFQDARAADDMMVAPPIAITAQAGFRATSSFVPGLFIGANVQLNFNLHSREFNDPMRRAFIISAGYIF